MNPHAYGHLPDRVPRQSVEREQSLPQTVLGRVDIPHTEMKGRTPTPRQHHTEILQTDQKPNCKRENCESTRKNPGGIHS